ncbi:hypothetical protein [Coraliomargarita parva]|uniref:hypothetical protein n=1 Tax=Coraliomargarita parva TaxID=3014050 RepID=UPI0022B422A9|nr:hypothetical protein [Coraliomargarita parva]
METLETNYGSLAGISSPMTYPDGCLKSCMFTEANRIETPVGALIPQYRTAGFGERQKKHRSALTFFKNGQIKAAALDEQMPIQTPLGLIKAELVTFYEDGSVNRVFPLNGQIDGFWSEQQEGELAEFHEFDLPVGKISAKVISIHFYPGGELKTLTLWPGQRVTVESPAGPILTRTGFSLYEDGSLRSVEPARPVELPTPIGLIKAFDSEIIGMHADQNSVQFSPEGTLVSVKTVHTGIRVAGPGKVETRIEPLEAASLIDIEQMRTVPMQIDFSEGSVRIAADKVYEFASADYQFSTFDRARVLRETCGGCSGGGGECSGCTGGDSCCQNS